MTAKSQGLIEPMKRKPISKRVRFEIFKRDAFQCQYCGKHPPNCILHVDHVIPLSKGGDNDPSNLITACDSCNLGKSNISLDRSSIGKKPDISIIKEKEAQIRAYNDMMADIADRIEKECWRIIACLEGDDDVERYNKQRILSIKIFLKKLSFCDVLEAAEITYSRFGTNTRAFKYFCGICWSKIRGNEDGQI